MPELFDYRFRVQVHPDSLYGKLPAVNFSVIRLTEQGTTIAATVH